MIAIISMIGTKYDCNDSYYGDLILLLYLQCWSRKGLSMIAIIENLLSLDSSRNHSHVSSLQAYMVPVHKIRI